MRCARTPVPMAMHNAGGPVTSPCRGVPCHDLANRPVSCGKGKAAVTQSPRRAVLVWLGHGVITEYLERADSTLLRLNLLLLLFVSFLPFPTKLVAEYLGARHNERVATTIYGLTLLVAALLLWVLWRYAVRAGLVRLDVDDVETSELTVRLTPGLAFYVVLIVLGLFVPEVAVAGYLAVALYFIIPVHRHGYGIGRRVGHG